MRLTVLAFAAAAALPGAAAAQECDRADESQTGMNICAAADYRAADAELNQTYDKIVKRLGADDATKKRLKEAQRAWIAFRDAECDLRHQRQPRRLDLSDDPGFAMPRWRSPVPAASSCRSTSIARRAT